MDLDASQAKNIADCSFLNEQNYGYLPFIINFFATILFFWCSIVPKNHSRNDKPIPSYPLHKPLKVYDCISNEKPRMRNNRNGNCIVLWPFPNWRALARMIKVATIDKQ
jgi:hypothetical protein